MKKITLIIFILFTTTVLSQTNSTGQISFDQDLGIEVIGQIDVTATEETLTLGGPADRWFGVGFGLTSMTSGGDVVVWDGVNELLTDRTFNGVGATPSLDANQDWTVIDIDYTRYPGYVGLQATRSLTTSDPNDYEFNLTDTFINLVWARSSGAPTAGSFTLANHGPLNRGVYPAVFTLGTLGTQNLQVSYDFKIIPNPVQTEFELELPEGTSMAKVDIYDVFGKQIFTNEISALKSKINISAWNSGIYLVRVSSEFGTQSKRLIKQ